MSYCLNPDCQKPQNPNATKFCQSCGTKLLLAERYRAIKPIAQGGFGRTLLAEDEYKPSKPHCVIKQFYPQGQNKAGKAAELFQQEAVRLEQLGKHPQIPELFAHFEQDNRQYIVQEFIDGQNLAEELAEKGVFREKQIRSLLGDLLPVLQFIHEGQVIHRDIKPENIIRRRTPLQSPPDQGGARGGLVLVDFGAAKYATGTALGKTGTTIGSAGYAAPEQTFGQAVFASDIYSLGVTCIHLLTDIEPFELYNAMESAFVWRHYLGNNSVSDQLGRVLDKMTQSVVKQRYKSAEGVMQTLELSAEMHSSTATPVFPQLSPTNTSHPPTVQTTNTTVACAKISLITTLSGHSNSVLSVAISPDEQTVISGSVDRTIRLWQLTNTGWKIRTLGGWFSKHSGRIYSVALSPDGQILASGSQDNTIKLWQLITGQELHTLGGWFSKHSGRVYSVAFSPDGQILASGSQDNTIKLWNVSTGQHKRTIKGYSGRVRSVAFSSDGQTLANASYDGTINLWDTDTGQQKCILQGHLDLVYSIAFSSDGQTLVSGSADETIKLWDISTGKELCSIMGHSGSVFSVAFSSDGQTLVSGSADGIIRLWNVSTRQELCSMASHSGSVFSVAFSMDGQTLVSCGGDKTIKIWRVTR